ncbi:MAG: hypothetical protein K2M22_06790, partial [Lachnospiraceae bacterium]|nr:hypothetical protein [Lachnospiraceae bacterium]
MPSNSVNATGEAENAAAGAESMEGKLEGRFVYVGEGNGAYRITREGQEENVAAMTGAAPQEIVMHDIVMQDISLHETGEQDADGDLLGMFVQEIQEDDIRAAVGDSVYYVEVQNAPVYIKCTSAAGKDWLRRYGFNSLKSQDNASDDFAIKVNTVFAGDVTYEMVQDADLVYLEDGRGQYLSDKVIKKYISKEVEDGLEDISDSVITRLLYGAVEESKPVIVDFGITESKDYEGSKYQNLAKAFLKKDLTAFYHKMEKSDDLVASILMNVDKDSKEFPNKTDNDYHYVNRNVYVVNGTPLVGEDFPEAMDKNAAASGFTEVLAAI